MSLETTLLSSVGIEARASITMEDVNRRHESFMNNGNRIDSNKLIQILGGADAILRHYMSTNDTFPLSSEQLQSINELLIPTDINEFDMDSVTSQSDSIENPVLLIHQRNTFLHQILQTQIADKIVNFLFNRLMVLIIALMMFGIIIAVFFSDDAPDIVIVLITLFIPYAILVLLAINKTTTKLILQTFEFWFKIAYFLRLCICAAIYNKKCLDQHFTTAYVSCEYIAIFLSALVLCFVDGLKIPFRMKVSVLLSWSILYSVAAFLFTFFNWAECYIAINGSLKIDILDWITESLRIIAIFAWKQTLYSIFKEPKSTLIKSSVKIVWI